MLGVQFFLLNIEINEETTLFPFYRKVFSNVLLGIASTIFSGGKPQTPSFSLFLIPAFVHAYGLLHTLPAPSSKACRLASRAHAIHEIYLGLHEDYSP